MFSLNKPHPQFIYTKQIRLHFKIPARATRECNVYLTEREEAHIWWRGIFAVPCYAVTLDGQSVSFYNAPTLCGSETDGQRQTIAENAIPRMRKEVTLKQNKGDRARGLARQLPRNRCLVALCNSSYKVSQLLLRAFEVPYGHGADVPSFSSLPINPSRSFYENNIQQSEAQCTSPSQSPCSVEGH